MVAEGVTVNLETIINCQLPSVRQTQFSITNCQLLILNLQSSNVHISTEDSFAKNSGKVSNSLVDRRLTQ